MLTFLGAQLGTLDRCYELPEFDASHCGAEIATWFGFPNTEDFRVAIAQEQFWRIITPPPLRQDCYATDQAFCEFVDSSSVIGINWLGLLLCFWPSLVTGWSVWGWTRPSKPGSV